MNLLATLALSLPLAAFAQVSFSPCEVDTDCSIDGKASCTNNLCFCNDGYVALDQDPSFCLDLDECATGVAGCDSNNGFCVDYDPPQKFQCGCMPGFVCQNDACTRCAVDTTHTCSTNNGGCDSNADCNPLSNNRRTCSCQTGYTGDGFSCVVNTPAPTPAPNSPPVTAPVAVVCSTDTCLDSQDCTDNSGEAVCSCKNGYFTTGTGSCIDINECSAMNLNNCTADRSVCINEPGSVRCQCSTGFEDFPGSIRGTDCRTAEEIAAALSFGEEIVFDSGFDGLSAADLEEGSPARQGIVDTFVNDYDIEPDDVDIFNITEVTVTRRRLSDGRQLISRRALCGFRLRVRSEISAVTHPDQAAAQVRARSERVQTLVSALTVDPATGEFTATTTTTTTVTELIAIQQTFLRTTSINIVNRGLNIDVEVFRATQTFTVTRLVVVRTIETITVTEAAGDDPNSPFIQQAFEDGVSVAPSMSPVTPAPTPSPSIMGTTSRFLVETEEEDFFGDIASSPACKCIDCDPHQSCMDLWKGRSILLEDAFPLMETHAVISVCRAANLGWLAKYLEGTIYSSVTIISRCGKDLSGIAEGAEIFSDTQYADDDQAFLSWIERNYNADVAGTVLFLNEDPKNAKSMTAMQMAAAAESNSFQCGSAPGLLTKSVSKSAFCDEFGELVQKCEAGIFAATMEAIRGQELIVWKSGATEWAALLSPALTAEEAESVRSYATGSDANGCLTHDYNGMTPSWVEEQDDSITATVSRFLAKLFEY